MTCSPALLAAASTITRLIADRDVPHPLPTLLPYWYLPEAIRAGIVAMVKAAAGDLSHR